MDTGKQPQSSSFANEMVVVTQSEQLATRIFRMAMELQIGSVTATECLSRVSDAVAKSTRSPILVMDVNENLDQALQIISAIKAIRPAPLVILFGLGNSAADVLQALTNGVHRCVDYDIEDDNLRFVLNEAAQRGGGSAGQSQGADPKNDDSPRLRRNRPDASMN